MSRIVRRRIAIRVAAVCSALTMAVASPAVAMEWECRSGSSNVIDCRSGTCVAMEPYEPSLWQRFKCAIGLA